MRNNAWRLVVASSLLLGASSFFGTALAAGDPRLDPRPDKTYAGTTVSNTAVVNYKINGSDQELVESSPIGNDVGGLGNGFQTTFIVDRKLSLLVVADIVPVEVAAGYTSGPAHPAASPDGAFALKYTVTNQSNSYVDIKLQAFDDVDGDLDDNFTDAITTTNFRYFLDDGTTPGVLDVGDTEMTGALFPDPYLDAMDFDETRTVFVVADIEGDATASAAEYANVTLAGQIYDHNSGVDETNPLFGNPDNLLGPTLSVATVGDTHTEDDGAGGNQVSALDEIDTIFVDVDLAQTDPDGLGGGTPVAETTIGDGPAGTTDAVRDAQHADTAHYIIVGTIITVKKTSTVISDPFTGVSPDAIRIPGAVIQYEIVITNSGGLDADAVTVTDDIPANTTYVPDSVTIAVNGGAASTTTDGTAADPVFFDGGDPGSLTIQAGTIDANDGTNDGEVIITFDVIID